MAIARANNSILKVISGGGGGGGSGAYILDEMPSDDFGADGEYAVVLQKLVAGDNGTIIPVQASGSTSCFANSSATDAYKAFNNNTGDSFSFTSPGYVGYDFGENDKKKIKSVSFVPGQYNYSPYNTYLKFFLVQASNDGISWKTLSCATIPQLTGWFTISFDNDAFYRYYRLFAYSTYSLSSINIREIHMNDAEPAIVGNPQPTLFRKRCGQWVTDAEVCRWTAVMEPRGIYRPNGASGSTTSLVSGLYDYTTNSTVTVEAKINRDMFAYGSQQQLVGTSYSGGGFNNGVVAIQFQAYANNNVTMVLAHGPNSGQSFTSVFTSNDLVNATDFKAVFNGGDVKIYLDDVLKAHLTLSNFTVQSGTITQFALVGHTAASSPNSPQMGVTRIHAVSNVDGHIEFDFVAAFDLVSQNAAFIERRYGLYFKPGNIYPLPDQQP